MVKRKFKTLSTSFAFFIQRNIFSAFPEGKGGTDIFLCSWQTRLTKPYGTFIKLSEIGYLIYFRCFFYKCSCKFDFFLKKRPSCITSAQYTM